MFNPNTPGSRPSLHTRVPSSNVDQLSKVTEQLSQAWTPEGVRRVPHHAEILKEYVEAEAYGLPPEAFARFTSDLYSRILQLIQSPQPADKLAGILAIDNLIDVNLLGEHAAKMNRFATHLSSVFHPTTDVAVMEVAAEVLGHLVRSGGALTAEVVDHEVKRSLTWLQGERVEVKRYAAVLLLKEMAENAPAVFNVHVRSFIEQVWSALRDPKRVVREAACLALRACLCLVEKRETRFRVQWYYRLFEETQRGLSRGTTVEVVHGSLLALGELLRHTGEFMLARYREVVTTVLKFRDSRERIIRLAVISLLPRLAHFSPERFAVTYLPSCTEFLLSVLHQPRERGPGFEALGDMALALSCTPRGVKGLESTLHPIAQHLMEALAAARRRDPCPEAVKCAGVLAKAVGGAWASYAEVMLEPMICTGLSDTLVTSLATIARHIPQLRSSVQEQLLDMVSLVLARRPFREAVGAAGPHLDAEGPGGPPTRAQLFAQAIAAADPGAAAGPCSPPLVCLALRTLGEFFDSGPGELLDFVKERVLRYLEDDDLSIRSEAADACVRVLEAQAAWLARMEEGGRAGRNGSRLPTASPPPGSMSSHPSPSQSPTMNQMAAGGAGGQRPPSAPPPAPRMDPYSLHLQKRHRVLTEAILARLLVLAVSDPERRVRRSMLDSLVASDHLRDYLAQPDCLRCLFLSLNDEHFPVRASAIRLVGQLAPLNPAYAMPAMRRHILQLMTDLHHSPDSKFREESSQLLSCLIQSLPRLALLFVDPLMKGLLERLGALASSLRQFRAAAQGLPSGGTAASAIAASKLLSRRSKEFGVLTSVLVTLGDLCRVAGTAVRPYVSDTLPLVIDCLQENAAGNKREVIVMALGDLVASTGCVVSPYLQFPQLMGILLYLLGEGGDPAVRRAVIRTLGIIGALDPYSHRQNEMVLQGEDQLDKEGVRAQHVGGNTARAAATAAAAVAEPGAPPPPATYQRFNPAGAAQWGGDDQNELLVSSGLMTSHEDYYPTVAINALVRVLRDVHMASHHPQALRSLTYIFQALSVQCVPYLQKVLPVLFNVMSGAEDQLKQYIFEQLRHIVQVARLHMRKHLPELLSIVHQYWTPGADPKLILAVMRLVSELAQSVREDFTEHLPDLLPKFIAVFTDAERSGAFTALPPIFEALEALGPAVEDHLHLLLPAMLRLVNPTTNTVPNDVARECLLCLRRLLPTMQLAAYASAVLHPLLRIVETGAEPLRLEAAETIAFLAPSLGPEFSLFVPIIKKTAAKAGVRSARLDAVAAHVSHSAPPCLSDADDWESDNVWVIELEAAGARLNAKRPIDSAPPAEPPSPICTVNESALRRAWMSSERSTKEDWLEWMRNFSVELLKESPSPALRACHALAQLQPGMARELFPAGFVSCWNVLSEPVQEQLVRSLEAALASPTIPPEIVTSLLNLAEFMEHDEKALPLDYRTLGALAEKCHAFAKALHYKEIEFQTSPQTAVEALISINNHLRQPDAAVGILVYAQQNLGMEPREALLEKLQRWEEALAAYDKRADTAPPGSQAHVEATLGRLRCLAALAEWDQLGRICRDTWRGVEPHLRREIGPMAAAASWHMGQWGEMSSYVDALDSERDATGAFLRAVLCVRGGDYPVARLHVERARELLGTELAALVGESYERAYGDMVRIQQLTELEEVIDWRVAELTLGAAAPAAADLRARIKGMWSGRLRGVQRNVEVWQALLSVRTLVLPMEEDRTTWVKFASLCRKSGRTRQATKTLVSLLRYDPLTIDRANTPGYGAGSGAPDVMFAYLKLLWNEGEREAALNRMVELYQEVTQGSGRGAAGAAQGTAAVAGAAAATAGAAVAAGAAAPAVVPPILAADGSLPTVSPGTASGTLHGGASAVVLGSSSSGNGAPTTELLTTLGAYETPLLARVAMRLGLWQWTLDSDTASMADSTVSAVMSHLRRATEVAPQWGKCWHHFALFNCAALDHYSRTGTAGGPLEAATRDPAVFVTPAVRAFFRSIALGQGGARKANNLQDLLRLLTLWFNYGSEPDVEAALQEGFGMVRIDTWLQVIPQVIARIHMRLPAVRALIHNLLVRIGRHHPQALMYPLLVACKSSSPSRRAAALGVLEVVRQISASLVDQAQLVSRELIRVAILWHEMWHEALEEASRLYFGESNVEGMLATLLPLHELMERPTAGQPQPPGASAGLDTSAMFASLRDLDQRGPTTPMEVSFVHQYGRELAEAHEWCLKYRTSRKEAELHQAWDLYYHVFKRINKQLPSLTTLELQYVSPALVRATNLELAIPGTYIAGEPVVHIAGFAPQLHVITSKQRPRKLSLYGSDGASYMFLLKGHEDLRQDERVMQLFGLVNSLLAANRSTAERSLSIARYAVIPLSPNSGLIGWVPNCDTLHALIREFRDARKIPLNIEHRLMLGMAPDYDHLTVIQKVEVFEHALDSTSGEDLHKVLWLKSRTSELWLARRTNYTRSTAVMSMVGYILGLGDRHPSNLMLDRYSGKLLHIDFGDCFEASMHREKFPERVPFRLTRMMIKAMEVSGIEGNFRSTCESVMKVLRSNKDSVMAMLEAFVHDPLINWRLLHTETAAIDNQPAVAGTAAGAPGASAALTQDVRAQQGEPGGGYPPDESMQSGVNGGAAATATGATGVAAAAGGGGAAGAAGGLPPDATEALNERAVTVMRRMGDKLTGRDFHVEGHSLPQEYDTVPVQVVRLIKQATSHENLALSYVGWCAFW